MTTNITTTYEDRRQAHIATLLERFPPMIERLTWPEEQLAAHRQAQLRALVAHAVAKSPFHRERLGHLDPARLTEADLASVPTMDKRDLMAHFDDIVTDDRLTRDVVEAHLESCSDEPAYLFDEYHVMATGGSSGSRTLVVWDWDGWADVFVSMSRMSLVRGGEGGPVASIAADHPTHMSSLFQRTFSNPAIEMHRVPASLPIEAIVERLNALQPETLLGYASMIQRLAIEALSGRLRIAPAKVLSGSEALLPETRAFAEEAWGVVLDNTYGSSEVGGIAASCGRGPWMHLSDDLHVIEVQPDAVVVTNLLNRAVPLIRYVHDDRTRLLDVDCPCGSAHRVIGDVDGRTDDTFTFAGDVKVHPIVFSAAIGKLRGVVEYQVRQRVDGVDIDIVSADSLDLITVRHAVERSLDEAGAPGVGVSVRAVDAIARHGTTAKLRRFVPA